MAELGALSLRIEETGGDQVLRQVKTLDATAKQAGVSLDNAAKVLTKLGISAKVVGGQIQVAQGQTAQAAAIVQKLGVTAQVTSGQEEKLAQSTQQVARAQQQMTGTSARATSSLTLFGKEVVTSQGRLSAFSTRTISGLNAAAFSLSSLASGGQVSFRTLSTAAAGFAAFFGPGGAIASIAITAGLAISDFFLRTRREIEETKQKAKEALKDLRDSIEGQRRQGDQEGLIERVRQATLNLAESEEELARIQKQLLPIDAKLEQMRKLSSVAAALKKRNEDEATKALRERRAELEATIPLLKQEIALSGQAALNPREPAPQRTLPIKVTAGTAKAETKAAADAEKERQEAIARTVAAIVTLNKLDRQTGQDLVALIDLEGQLTAELNRGNVTRERRADIETQLASLRTAQLTAPAVRAPLGGGAVGPAQTITMPASVRATLNPEQIARDVQQMDAQIAERVRGMRFEALEDSLSSVLGTALAAGIVQGFVQGFSQGGIAEGFQQMTAQLLSGLGNAAISFAVASQGVAELMAVIKESLATLNPWVALAAGVALAALGAKLGGAARSSFGGGGSFSGGGFSGGGSAALSVHRLIVDPNAGAVTPRLARIGTSGLADGPRPQVINVIGINTPQGQAMIGESNARYQRRGG